MSERDDVINVRNDYYDAPEARRRAYMAPPDALRCTATRRPLRDGTDARCMRKATVPGGLCPVHLRVSAAK